MKIKILVGFMVIALLGIGTIFLKDNFSEYKKEVNYAYDLLDEGKYDEAVLSFNKAIDIDNKKEDAYLGLMDTYTKQGGEDAPQKICSVLNKGLSNSSSTKNIQQKYENIIAKYKEKNDEDAVSYFKAASNNSEKIQNGYTVQRSDTDEYLTQDQLSLYEDYVAQSLEPKYGIMNNTEVLYTTGTTEEDVFDQVNSGIAKVTYLDLDDNQVDEMIVTIVEHTGISVEAYTINQNQVVPISVDKSVLNDTDKDFDEVNGINLNSSDQINRMGIFYPTRAYGCINLFMKEKSSYNLDRYLCIEFTPGYTSDGGILNTDGQQTFLEVYELKNGTLYLLDQYELSAVYDTYFLYDNGIQIAEHNYFDDGEDTSEFVNQVCDELSKYDLSDIYSNLDNIEVYNDYNSYLKVSERQENIVDIIRLYSCKDPSDNVQENYEIYNKGIIYIEK